jgi:uncharacterized protein GlcG (DUF336 family)
MLTDYWEAPMQQLTGCLFLRPIVLATMAIVGAAIFQPASAADGLLSTHRLSAALANEAVAACVAQGYHESAVVVDADGVIQAVLRGDGTGVHSLDSAHDKAFTSASFKNDTLAMASRAAEPLFSKLPNLLLVGGGVAIKVGDETVGAIGAAGAPGGNLDDGCAKAGLAKIADQLLVGLPSK